MSTRAKPTFKKRPLPTIKRQFPPSYIGTKDYVAIFSRLNNLAPTNHRINGEDVLL